jgi:DNA-binding transcriptional regulator YiaG
MAKKKPRNKYEPLHRHLRRTQQDEVTLTFAEIEGLLGDGLPETARTVRGWWSNRHTGSSQAVSWMDAGYHVVALDLAREQVTFRKPIRRYYARRVDDVAVWDGELIKGLREHMGFTQGQFAQEMGIRQQTVSEWETGVYAPTRATAKHLELIAERAGFKY